MNPKLDFYAKLLAFAKDTDPSERRAIEIVAIYDSIMTQISIRHSSVSVVALMGWSHGFTPSAPDARKRQSQEMLQHFSACAYQDLLPQTRNPAVQKMLKAWSRESGSFTIGVGKVQRLKGGIVTLTLVASDENSVRMLLGRPHSARFVNCRWADVD